MGMGMQVSAGVATLHWAGWFESRLQMVAQLRRPSFARLSGENCAVTGNVDDLGFGVRQNRRIETTRFCSIFDAAHPTARFRPNSTVT